MRILFVTEFLPASERAEITGGVEARCHYVIDRLRRRNDVEVIARWTDGTVWDAASVASLPGRLAFLARALVRGLRTPFDVVEGSNLVVYPVAWLLGVLKRRPVVFWYPDVLIGTWRSAFGRFGVVLELLERLVLHLPGVTSYIAISETTASKLRRHGVDADRIVVVPCGFDPGTATRVRSEAATDPAPPGGRTIAVVSRLVPYKRVDVVVEAVGRLARSHPDVVLHVVGQGPERAALEARGSALGVGDRIVFHGFVGSHADVLRRVAAATVFVHASEVEGFGIVVVEAMALGVPYVVSDIPVFREVTGNGVGGLLFPPGDAGALADALAQVLDDPARRERLTAEGRAYAERYDWTAIADRTESALAAAVSGRGSA
jgi:glycosyltransferase involved in cell wall biosynthesis